MTAWHDKRRCGLRLEPCRSVAGSNGTLRSHQCDSAPSRGAAFLHRIGSGGVMARFIVGLIFWILASPCFAEGAIAVSKSGIQGYGISNNQSQVNDAVAGALQHCNAGRTGFCTLALSFRNECAIVGNTSDRMIYTRGNNLHEARQNFLKECNGQPCKVGLSACDGTVLEEQTEAATALSRDFAIELGSKALRDIATFMSYLYHGLTVAAATLLWIFALIFYFFGKFRRDLHQTKAAALVAAAKGEFPLSDTVQDRVAGAVGPDSDQSDPPPATLAELIVRSDPTPPNAEGDDKELSGIHY
jgi:hypothetical protein